MVNVDFDGVKPVEEDYHGVRCLLVAVRYNLDVWSIPVIIEWDCG